MAEAYLNLLKSDPTDASRVYASWVGSPNFADRTLTYSTDALAGYYGTIANPTTLLTGLITSTSSLSALQPSQNAVVDKLLEYQTSDSYRVSFSDVANIIFQSVTSQPNVTGDIAIIRGDLIVPPSAPQNATVLGSTFSPLTTSFSNIAGDIFLDDSSINLQTQPGQDGFLTILHELGHAIGLNETDVLNTNAPDLHGLYPLLDNVKFTAMSYNDHHPEMVGSLRPFGLQLLDVAAVQELYGRNYDEDTVTVGIQSVSTTYKVGQGFSTTEFIYTIWDGGGSDKIDATGYADGVQVDLRQGHFSSIGLSGKGGSTPWVAFDTPASSGIAAYDAGNVAIAFHTIIENAIGTSENDILIGNAWSNRLEGGAGNDTLYGDGEEYDGDRGFTDVDNDNPDGAAPASDNDTFVGGRGEDEIYGGGGSDTVDYSQDTNGVDVFIGEDVFLGGDGSFAYDGWGDLDTLRSIESITGSAFDDRFTIDAPLDEGDRTFNGGAGQDSLHYAIWDDSTGVGDSRVVIDAASGTANWQNSTDQVIDIERFDNVTYLPDLSDDYSFTYWSDAGSQSVIVSYAHATQGGTFILQGDIYGETSYEDETPVSVTFSKSVTADIQIGDSNHSGQLEFMSFQSDDPDLIDLVQDQTLGLGYGAIYESNDFGTQFGYTTIAGTNFGDDVFLSGIGHNSGIEFISGKGNDDIAVDMPAYEYAAYDYSVVITYTGGNDSITGNIGALQFAEYINEDQITITGDVVDGALIGDGVITISGLGSITIDADEYNPTSIIIPGFSLYDPMLYGLSFQNQTITGDLDGNLLYGSFGIDTISGGGSADRLYGAAGDDALSGDDGNDELSGGVGNDTLNGGADADTLYGNAGNDTLNGGSGSDFLDGGAGNDTIDGGGDIDTVSYKNAGGAVRIYLGLTTAQDSQGSGLDTITNVENVEGSAFNDVIEGNAGNNFLDGGDGTDTVTYANATGAVSVEMLYSTVYVSGAGTDTIFGFENVTGSNFNDTFYAGTTADNVFSGLSGDDLFYYSAGNDTYDGGDGLDAISYFYASSALNINLLNGSTSVGANTQNLASIEIIYAGGYNDTITGDYENNEIYGNNGNDTIDGSGGNDYLSGGAGNDLIIGGAGTDTLDGGADYDEVSYFFATSGVNVNLGTGSVTNDGMGSTDYLSNIEGAYGGAYDDVIAGSSSNNDLYGNAGNDRIEGGLGNDYIDGGAGIDTASYAGANGGVTVNLTLSGLQNTVAAGSDVIVGIENIVGSVFNDTLTGDGGDNTIEGGLGNDIMAGGAGTDTLTYANAASGITISLASTSNQNTGGAGTDKISAFENLIGSAYNDTLTGSSGANLIEGGLGDDTMNGGSGVDTLDYTRAVSAVTLSLALTSAQNTGGAGTDTITAFENILGSAFNDNLTGSSAANVIEGGAGDDYMDGGTGTDTLSYARASGGVTVSLAVTTAQITGGAGTDTIVAFENLTGSAFDDVLTGSTAANVMEGGLGNDTINGGSGTDTLTYVNAASGVTVSLALTSAQNTVGAGIDTVSNFEKLTGSAFDDNLSGNSAANTIDGGLGNDRIFADAGNDTLNGNTGIDTLDFANIATAVTVNLTTTSGQATGGAGTDTYTNFENVSGTAVGDTITGNTLANILNGRGGADTLTGGTGADTFYFDTSSLGSIDTVTDFATAQGDKLDISNLLFSFDPLQNLLDDYVSFATSGSNSTMSVDRDGAGSAYTSQTVASFTGVTGLDADTLYSSGNLIA